MLIVYVVASLVAFTAWGIDKFLARSRSRRISERSLLILVWLGGAFGALLGMLLFRHKTRKGYFWLHVGGACLAQASLLVYLTFMGFSP